MSANDSDLGIAGLQIRTRKKVLLIGKSNSGKTSMRSIIFSKGLASETKNLTPTNDVEFSSNKFLSSLILDIWDCGGQDLFMEDYFSSRKNDLFSNVEIMIHVFNVKSQGEELGKDMDFYRKCVIAIALLSPSARVFCLINKMDLVRNNQRDRIFTELENKILIMSRLVKCVCYKSSIWDETLYTAWCSIINHLVPNVETLKQSLKKFAETLECEEVFLFERATFLIISHYKRDQQQQDLQRSEKIFRIIKQFKLRCADSETQFNCIEVRNSKFVAYLDKLTTNTFILVVILNANISTSVISMNIKSAQKHFEEIEKIS